MLASSELDPCRDTTTCAGVTPHVVGSLQPPAHALQTRFQQPASPVTEHKQPFTVRHAVVGLECSRMQGFRGNRHCPLHVALQVHVVVASHMITHAIHFTATLLCSLPTCANASHHTATGRYQASDKIAACCSFHCMHRIRSTLPAFSANERHR
jgi:hypothetical protein